MRLQYLHSTPRGQSMLIETDYSVDEYGNGTLDNVQVYVIEKGVKVLEISKLLDDAEGEPLTAMLEAIDWHEMYIEKRRDYLIR